MSYYGYPNPQAYNAAANYQAYAAAYAGGTYDQYQAAYNAAAFRAMQQQQPPVPGQPQSVPPPPPPPPPPSTNQSASISTKPSASISQPAQRYDYSLLQQQTAPTSTYDVNAYASNMMNPMQQPKQNQQQNRTQNQAKWNSMVANNNKKANQFQRRGPRNPNSQSVQIFYCEVCKISCAGPQTYKEHLDGQKHKKREQANKIQTEQSNLTASNMTSDPTASPNQQGNNQNGGNWKQRNQMNRNSGFSRNSAVIKCELCDVACTGRDAYLAHVRGTKHQKTIKLHQKLGKPIPPDALDILNAAANVTKTHTPTTTIAAPVTYPQPSLVPPQLPLVSSLPPTSTELIDMSNQMTQQIPLLQQQQQVTALTDDQNILDEQMNVEPIGREYIETRLEGKILSFYCKLCECHFNDPNAKDMHTKGRRHRLAYKKKVDPSLRVDIKSNSSLQRNNSNKMLRERNLNTRRNLSQTSPNDSLNASTNNINNATTSATSNTTGATNGTNGSTTSIMPLMSTNLTDNPSLPINQQQPTQTIQQLMSQPLKAPTNWNTNSNFPMQSNQMRQGESFDDRHILAKHNMIYPSQEEINAIQEIVNSTEKALKLVSDQIAEEDKSAGRKTLESQQQKTTESETNNTTSDNNNQTESTNTDSNQMYRALKGVMRVGLLAKGLLLKGDTDVQLIVLCADKPTKRLLERVHLILLEKIDIVSPQIKYNVILDKQAETIVIVKTTISDLQPLITCKVLLTSPAVRTFTEQVAADQINSKTELTNINNNNEENDDLLDKQRCLDSLAALRHSKWFQARASNVTNCVIIIRILRDLCRRNPTWSPLSQWGLELLVERSLSSSNQTLSPGEGLRRVLECVSSGVLLPNGCGLYDPCEKDPTDVADTLKSQQREELTASAQMALRLLAFKQIHKILGMECLSSSNHQQMRQAKKRPNSSNENEIEDKKGRLESALNVHQTSDMAISEPIVSNPEIKIESTSS